MTLDIMVDKNIQWRHDTETYIFKLTSLPLDDSYDVHSASVVTLEAYIHMV